MENAIKNTIGLLLDASLLLFPEHAIEYGYAPPFAYDKESAMELLKEAKSTLRMVEKHVDPDILRAMTQVSLGCRQGGEEALRQRIFSLMEKLNVYIN